MKRRGALAGRRSSSVEQPHSLKSAQKRSLLRSAESLKDLLKVRSQCEVARKREQFKASKASGEHQGGQRSISAPPRKRWFKTKENPPPESNPSSTSTLLCDEVTKRLISAIAWWHDIHSNLLRLSFEEDSFSSSHSSLRSSICDGSEGEEGESDNENEQQLGDEEDDNRCTPDSPQHDAADLRRLAISSKHSLSNPDLTATQLEEMFPELSDYWR
ncbi:unnamed protein product, partial [Mesorhabditis belari]|uniref:Uncharacterized protein n=1 Tax=Mesorhabditis belari TaxID=2138241 RepID=A0AAF3FGX7_9BILA